MVIVISVVCFLFKLVISSDFLRIVAKVNKAGRMAEHCGRKGSKQQVAFDDDDAAADDDDDGYFGNILSQ